MSSFKKWESQYKNSWFSCVPGKNGFLPVAQPLYKLPPKYEVINDILKNMKMNKSNGTKGYLHDRMLGTVINEELPLFNISNENDIQLLAALQRDYYFLASAYSLETSHPYGQSGNYNKARTELPQQLAIPLLQLSEKNGVYPWMDYAYGYGLNNALLIGDDPKDYTCYKTIRTFNGSKSEEGFINVHVAMVAQSGDLLKYQQECLYNLSIDNVNEFNKHLKDHYLILSNIVETLQTMWKASSHNEYLSFRTFIMAQKGNHICYPDETITFNLLNDTEKVFSFRGETGAQDSIIPSVDSFLHLDYPKNKLTEYLFDLRNYRPKDHQEYINFVNKSSKELNFKQYVYKNNDSCILLLKNLNCLRMFRKKHWNLTKKYIIENTKHPVATGGTPITTWLPNQLGATLAYMQEVIDNIKEYELNGEDLEYYKTMKIELSDHIQSIMDEVNTMQRDFKNQDYHDFVSK